VRPYGGIICNVGIIQNDNTVKMVRHNHEIVQFDFGPNRWRPQPFFVDDLSNVIQFHFVADNFSEEALPFIGAECHKVPPTQRIVPMLESHAAPVMYLGIV
jgi:hypothetical protein